MTTATTWIGLLTLAFVAIGVGPLIARLRARPDREEPDQPPEGSDGGT